MAKPLSLGLFITFLALAIASAAASAQAPPDQNRPEPPPTNTTLLFNSLGDHAVPQPDPDSGLMTLDLVARDQKGQPVSGLTGKDFKLLDNGQPEDLVTFQAYDGVASQPNPPVEIILVIDEIDTPALDLIKVKETAQKFLQQNGGHLSQPTMIYRITNDGLSASTRPSADGNALAAEINEKKGPRTIWRAVDIAGSFQRDVYGSPISRNNTRFNEQWVELPHSLIALGSIAIEERRIPGRKMLFWIGSPWPRRSNRFQHLFETVTELSTRLREARITLWLDDPLPQANEETFAYEKFLAGVTSEKTLAIENLAFQVLAPQSGGGVLLGDGDAVDQISKSVARANSFYTITFDPQRDDTIDAYHELKIDVNKPGLTVRTRAGYYDEPAYYDQVPNNVEHVTVAQLLDAITALRSSSGSETEGRLKKMRLIERLPSADLEKLIPDVKGNNAKEALIALADQSAFLPPPAQDIPKQPPPAVAEQRQIIQRVIDYVNKTVPILPELNAERTTNLYLELPRALGQTWKAGTADQSLYPAVTTKESIHVSNGKEIAQSESVKKKSINAALNTENRTLQTVGTFGPILASILVGVAQPGSKLQWSRWEHGEKAELAVFRFQIPGQMHLFHAGFCCLAIDDIRASFEIEPPSHGEITVDPASGAIVRLTIMAGLGWRLPLERSDIMVEYSEVMLGGTNYYCPSRSVSISRQRSVVQVTEFGETFKVYAPYETVLNDMTYENYHLFRSTSRILPGFAEAPDSK